MRITRHLGFALAVVLVGALSLQSTPARATSTTPYYPRVGKALGIVPTLQNAPATSSSSSVGQLYYNGGPVMSVNEVYAIYWAPSGYSFPAGYSDLINQYFGDVQADHGKNTNVYASDTQYYQQASGATTFIQNNSTFRGFAFDSDPLPPLDPVNCPDALTPGACVTDAQMQQEISAVIKAHGWPVDNSTEFFMFTAPKIGTCFPAGVGVGEGGVQTQVTAPLCSFDYFCAYHSAYYDSTINASSQVIYANMPYAPETAGMPVTCDEQQYPNGNPADAEINVLSHEHNESITDPFGTGWWDSNPNDADYGMETGDMCAWNFGTTGGASGAEYSQTINGHHYFMQMEWSNADGGCVQREFPLLTLTPSSGYPTAPFKISALFYDAGDNVPFTWTNAGSATAQKLGSATANASGQLSLMTKVPGSAKPGTATVSGTGSLSQDTGKASFSVLS